MNALKELKSEIKRQKLNACIPSGESDFPVEISIEAPEGCIWNALGTTEILVVSYEDETLEDIAKIALEDLKQGFREDKEAYK